MKLKITIEIEAYPNPIPPASRVETAGIPKGDWVAHTSQSWRADQLTGGPGTGATMQAAVQDLLLKLAHKMGPY